MTSKTENVNVDELIIELIKNEKPHSIGELAGILEKSYFIPEKVVLESIVRLKAKNNIQLIGLENQRKNQYLWFQIVIALGAVTVFSTFAIPEGVYPWIYVRNLLGLLFVFFLPGYAFLKALLPSEILTSTNDKDLQTISRIGLSLGISIVLVSMLGLLLYYSPWGLNSEATVAILFTMTCLFGAVSIIRNK